MLMGLVMHATLLYSVPELAADLIVARDISPEEPTPWTWVLIIWIHQWRMPLFFLLAGFFAELVMDRGGPKAWAKDRVLRIAGTLAVFMVIFSVVLSRPLGSLDHLWFLWFLCFYCLYAGLLRIAGPFQWQGWASWPFQTPWHSLSLIPILTLASLIGRSDGLFHDIPEQIYEVELGGLALYLVPFVIGQGLYWHRSLIGALALKRVWLPLLATGTLSTFAVLVAFSEADSRLLVTLTGAITTWAWTFGFIGLFEWAVRRRSSILDWVVRVSYPVYLFHLYVVIQVSAVFILWGWGQAGVIVGSSVVAFAISVALYYLFVWWTPLDWFLAGPKKARLRWPFRNHF